MTKEDHSRIYAALDGDRDRINRHIAAHNRAYLAAHHLQPGDHVEITWGEGNREEAVVVALKLRAKSSEVSEVYRLLNKRGNPTVNDYRPRRNASVALIERGKFPEFIESYHDLTDEEIEEEEQAGENPINE